MKINDLKYLLRKNNVLGTCSDPFGFHLMWSSEDSLLLRYVSNTSTYDCWLLVRRTGVQYYKVVSCVTKFDYSYSDQKSFRNSRLTAEYIKNFIK